LAKRTTDEIALSTLEEALERYTSDVLKELAKLFEEKPPTKKADRIMTIVKALSGGGLQHVWNKLEPLAKSALAEVVHSADGRLNEAQFESKYGGMPKRYTPDYHFGRKGHPYTLLDVLLVDNTIPRDIKEQLKQFVPRPAEARIKTVPELPVAVPEQLPSWQLRSGEKPDEQPLTVVRTERAALHDMRAVLRLIDAGKVSVSRTTNRVTSASADSLLAVLREGDFLPADKTNKAGDSIRPFAWPLIVQSAGLARLSGSKLELTRTGKSALSRPAHLVIESAWKRWLKNTLLDEFNRIEVIKGQKKKGRGGLTAAVPRRAVVNHVLSMCPAREWINIDEFFRFFRASGNEFEVSRDPWNLYITDSHYGSLGYAGFHEWSMLQGRYIMCLLWEYAGTLGLVDIAHVPAEWARNDFRGNWGVDDLEALSRYDGLKYFRVNALGAYCLGKTDDYEPTPIRARPALHVLANHEIVVTDRSHLEAGDTLFLDKVCVRAGESAWKIDRARILAAIEDGIDTLEIREFLTAKSAVPVPDNIVQFLEDVTRRASLLAHEGGAEVFRAADEATALLILNDKATKPLCYAAGKDRLIVPAENVHAFRRALRRLGYAAHSKKDNN